MLNIRYVTEGDASFWFQLDRHLSREEFYAKVRDQRGYLLLEDNIPLGILRYNLFWDSIPFCTLIYIGQEYQSKGYGRDLMAYWEQDMKSKGYGMVMTSTQTDEMAQHFYRKLGYQEAGSLILDLPGYRQPMEMFFVKEISLAVPRR